MTAPEDRCPTCGVPLSEPVQSDNCPVPEDHAQHPADPIPASISIDEDGLGDYTARVRVTDTDSWDPHSEFSVSLDTLYTMRLHINNAIRGLEERRLRDAIAGSCDLCSNTRMVRVERHGRPVSEHCPVCRPKLDAALEALRHGLVR